MQGYYLQLKSILNVSSFLNNNPTTFNERGFILRTGDKIELKNQYFPLYKQSCVLLGRMASDELLTYLIHEIRLTVAFEKGF